MEEGKLFIVIIKREAVGVKLKSESFLDCIKNGKKIAIFKRSQNVDPFFEGKVQFYTGDRNEITDLEKETF